MSLKSQTQDPQRKVPPGGLGLRIFTSWKNPSTSGKFLQIQFIIIIIIIVIVIIIIIIIIGLHNLTKVSEWGHMCLSWDGSTKCFVTSWGVEVYQMSYVMLNLWLNKDKYSVSVNKRNLSLR